MRVTDALCKLYKRSSSRHHNLELFKFKYYRDPILKNKVSGKGEKETRAVCVEEMALMLTCLKTNDFEEKPCSHVIDSFKRCVIAADERRERNEESRKMGHFNTDSDDADDVRKLSSIQVNRVLRKFPEP